MKYYNHIIYGIVFLIILVCIYKFRSYADIRNLLLIPGVGTGIVFFAGLWKDYLVHNRTKEIYNNEHDFILGISSHMSNVAYDKHVEFCEEYIARVQDAVLELYEKGPSKDAVNIGYDLRGIRRKHTTWLTKKIEDSLIPFEQAIIKIGANEFVLENLPVGEKRSILVKEIYDSFQYLLGIGDKPDETQTELAIDKIIGYLRNILGINTLTDIRLSATELALKRLNADL